MRIQRRSVLVALLLVPWSAAALPVATREGVVAAAHPLAAKAGARVLAEGGNAADALVATAFALSVVEPHSSGLGGGGFAMLYDARTGATRVLDFREVAPAKAGPELFLREGRYDPLLSRYGARAVAVPGAVAGYAELARAFGTRPLARLVEPAAQLAEKGFPLAAGHRRALGYGEALKVDPQAAAFFLLGRDPLGVRLRQPALARLLRAIGREGTKAFYGGPGAKAIVSKVAAFGGVLSLEDLAAYRVRATQPLEGSFRGHRVLTMPPPSAGGVTILHTLAALERLPTEQGRSTTDSAHALAEIWKRSYAARAAYLGDPNTHPVVLEYTRDLLAPTTIDALVRSIGPRATPAAEVGVLLDQSREGDDTTHLAAVDSTGNVALMTTTLNGPFGSGLWVSELGVLLNNEMDDFSPPEGGNLYGLVGGRFNRVGPGRIPLSTMAPTLVFRGEKPWIAVGAAGGSAIATTVAQVIVHVVDGGMNIQQALGAPRLHAQFQPDEVFVEPIGFATETLQALRSRGHTITVRGEQNASANGLTIDPDGLRRASADPRWEGSAAASDQVDAR
jgi:gamma-glutamyltranspeptidase/glutathione hydrolase